MRWRKGEGMHLDKWKGIVLRLGVKTFGQSSKRKGADHSHGASAVTLAL